MNRFFTKKSPIISLRINLQTTKITAKILIKTTKQIFLSLTTKKLNILAKNKHFLLIIQMSQALKTLKFNNLKKIILKNWRVRIRLQVQWPVNFINTINSKKINAQFINRLLDKSIQIKFKNSTLVLITFINFLVSCVLK